MTDSTIDITAGSGSQESLPQAPENEELKKLRKDLEALVSHWLINNRFKEHPFFDTPDLHFRAKNLLLRKADDSSIRTFNKYTYYVHVMVHLLIDHITSHFPAAQSTPDSEGELTAGPCNAFSVELSDSAHPVYEMLSGLPKIHEWIPPVELSDSAHPAYEIANGWPELLLWTPENVKKYIKERFNKERDQQRQNILRVMGIEMQNLLQELGWEIKDEDWSIPSQTS